MNALSLPQIENLRALVLENATELLAEAKLLFEHEKYARACALSHLSSEELAKLPMLAGVGVRVCKGTEVNWDNFYKKFSSHTAKLKILLSVDLLGTNVDPTTKDIRVHQKVMSRIGLFNELKNTMLYAGINQDSFYKPSALFTRAYAIHALTLASKRFELFATVEAHTKGRIEELASSGAYMKLLGTLRTGDDNYWSFVALTFKKLKDRRISASSILRENKKLVHNGEFCAYCGTTGSLQWEHIIPKSRGGSDTIDNMVLFCAKCNREKAAKNPIEWYDSKTIHRKNIPRIVMGKLLKVVLEEHRKQNTLDVPEYPLGKGLHLYNVCLVFDNNTNSPIRPNVDAS